MSAPSGHFIVVAADAHPVIDEWVWERARSEAATSGLALGEYLGREDVLPAPRPPDLCCHVFAADRPDQPEG